MNVQVEGYEVDAWFPRERLIVELDGYRYHQDRGAFERDPQARRDVACRRPGYGPRDLGSNSFENQALTVTAGAHVTAGARYDVALNGNSFNPAVEFVRGDMTAVFVG